MADEKNPSTGTPNPDNTFYTGQEVSTGDIGSSGISRRILHVLTFLSLIAAGACTIYGSFEAGSAVLALPFFTVLMWLFIHLSLILFARNNQHEFHPPSWFIFVASGHLFMQSIAVMIITIFKKAT